MPSPPPPNPPSPLDDIYIWNRHDRGPFVGPLARPEPHQPWPFVGPPGPEPYYPDTDDWLKRMHKKHATTQPTTQPSGFDLMGPIQQWLGPLLQLFFGGGGQGGGPGIK